MKVVFLDVDGVLNSIQDRFSTKLITESHINYLKEIVDKTGVVVVVSSSWRVIPVLLDRLINKLLDKEIIFYDKTGYICDYAVRGREISEWLSTHSDIESYVILDDEDYDMKEHSGNIVKTDMEYGLQKEHVGKAVKILNA